MDATLWFLRQLLRQRRSFFLVLLIGVAWALALGLRFFATDLDAQDRLILFRDGVGPFLIAAVVLLISMLYATSAFAQEIEDKTMFLLLTRPYPRARLLRDKALAAWLASAGPSVLAVALPALSLLPLEEARAREIAGAYVLAALLASTAYSALFLRVGLSASRPIIWAAGIAIGWEGLVGTTPGNLQLLTVQHQAARFLARTIAPETWTLELRLRVPEGSAWVPALCLLGFTALLLYASWRRLRSFELR
jgi:ABC-2 type transport system permease protein